MANAWMARAGRFGEREADALAESLIIAGWPEMDDLTTFATRKELRSAVRSAYPARSSTVVANWTGQLWRLVHIIEDGDTAAIHWQTRGTHQGEFMDVPATGRSITVTGASFLRFEDGRLAEEWVVWDPRELLSALGIWHLGSGN